MLEALEATNNRRFVDPECRFAMRLLQEQDDMLRSYAADLAREHADMRLIEKDDVQGVSKIFK